MSLETAGKCSPLKQRKMRKSNQVNAIGNAFYELADEHLPAVLSKIAAFCVVMGMVLNVGFAEEMVERVDGHVVRVDLEKRMLVIQFEHPVTEEKVEKEFFVPENTGFKEFKKLGDLKKDELVSIDYREEGTKANTMYVIRVPLTKAYVSPGELADAMAHLKTGKEK